MLGLEAIPMLLEKEFILLDVDVSTSHEVIDLLASLLIKSGRVRDCFGQACKEREASYPTGIPAAVMGLAIPHTSVEYVLEPAIAVARLRKPVTFVEMGTPDAPLGVQLVIMLAVKNPNDQLDTLQKLMMIFQDEEILRHIQSCSSVESLHESLYFLN